MNEPEQIDYLNVMYTRKYKLTIGSTDMPNTHKRHQDHEPKAAASDSE